MVDGKRACCRAMLAALAFCLCGALGNVGCGTSDNPGRVFALTRSGWVEGSVDSGTYSYLGIPYGASTGGANRWKAPAREAEWASVRNAQSYGPVCPQDSPYASPSDVFSEDCLYLNVWTPTRDANAGLPVMVWIPGGGFVFGAGSRWFYNGADLAKEGVVVVTINYRVNAFGFMAHDWFHAEGGPGANFGLLDQMAALEWVGDSIGGFGGDSENVTVFGESAGGSSISHLLAMPKASGLFHRAIVMSGVSVADYYVTEGITSTWAQASANGTLLQTTVGAATLSELREVNPDTLVKACQELGMSFAPVQDGWSITKPPRTALASLNNVDVMVGSLANDSIGAMDVGETIAAYQAGLRKYFQGMWNVVWSAYTAATDAQATALSVFTSTTAGFTEPSRYLARQAVARHGEAYRYYITNVPPGDEGKYGAAHGTEIAYVFGSATPEQGYEAIDEELSATIQKYWANFARTGNPNGSGVPDWPKFTAASEDAVVLDRLGIGTRVGVDETDCDFFEAIYPAVAVDNP